MLYRSKPTEIEAVQWTGRNGNDLRRFVGANVTRVKPGDHDLLLLAGKDGSQGWVPVPVGHWIVRRPGDLTDHWPVDPDYFAAKYEPVENEETWSRCTDCGLRLRLPPPMNTASCPSCDNFRGLMVPEAQ